ncbi:MAG: hypothetical protein CVU48_00590 [Candidatus Cloacimonetes bacterium HGW-Cloacimonetes-1]|jgi:RNA polymerase sigma-70 factor (ECF subfamily)|nr:MAG: hypothetical protein CVU48_00590 [Candidatus Cloacimonetes bacterium HGW-Cloacimonetes-1]
MKATDFESFLNKNQNRIYHYLNQMLGNEADAQDVIQTVFISFYENIDRIESATAVPYLYKIAYHKALTFIKQRKRYVLHDPVDFANLPDNNKPQAEPDHTLLQTAIRELPLKLATVIHLQYYEKLSYKEISEQLGISVKAVESLLVRAKRILRKKIVQDNTN